MKGEPVHDGRLLHQEGQGHEGQGHKHQDHVVHDVEGDEGQGHECQGYVGNEGHVQEWGGEELFEGDKMVDEVLDEEDSPEDLDRRTVYPEH